MEREYLYWLASLLFLSAKQKRLMTALVPQASRWHTMDEGELRASGIFTDGQVANILKSQRNFDVQGQYEWMKKKGIRFVSFMDEDFPRKLKDIPDPPFALFVKGMLPEDGAPAAAIVGARMCSRYGRETALLLGRALAGVGIQIISGMAIGIDGEGQRGALEAPGTSFAVLGCGPDICYPRENIELYMELSERGGILSEYPPGTSPMPYYFPARNRIISGLADQVIIVEAKEKSGSLITADQAMEQGKDVYAVPGRICDALSRGCNQLIKQGAGILLSPEDFLLERELAAGYTAPAGREPDLTEEERQVYTILKAGSLHIDELEKKVTLHNSSLAEVLLMLQLKGCVCETGKNFYSAKESIK